MTLLVLLFLFLLTSSCSSYHDETITNLKLSHGRQYIILPIDYLGLANRLRIISSIYTISAFSNRILIVIWKQNDDCPVSFQAIFEMNHKNVTVVDWDTSVSSQLRFPIQIQDQIEEAASRIGLTYSEIYFQSFRFDTAILVSDITIFWTRGTHSPYIECQYYLQLKQNFYRELKASDAVFHLVQSMKDKILSSAQSSVDHQYQYDLVGVHIRGHDFNYDWPVVNPIVSTNNSILFAPKDGYGANVSAEKAGGTTLRFDQAASLTAFITGIRSIIKISPHTKFFIARILFVLRKLWLVSSTNKQFFHWTVTL